LERGTLMNALGREITAAWETEEIRRGRRSPLDEVRSALAIFDQTLWNAVPEYLRSLDRTLRAVTGRGLPLEAAPIRFGSWIGGDRDGNPAVTPEVTRRASLASRWTALSLYAQEIERLREELSMNDASESLRARVGNAHEPYRALLREVQRGLEQARRHVEDQLSLRAKRAGGRGDEIYATAEQLAEPLRLCFDSLHATGNGVIANGRLADVLRRLSAFGLTLVRLDVRQEAARHTEAIDLIARQMGRPGYTDWSEEERVEFLTEALADMTSVPADLPHNPRTSEVLQTFDALAS